MDENLKTIMNSYIQDFIDAKTNSQTQSLINDNYIPVIWFGDMKEYFESDLKVITFSLNPSLDEFTEERFNYIDFTQVNQLSNINNLENTLNSYFGGNPYSWFNPYEKLLNGINTSYYTNAQFNNVALHIDLSAIPTNKLWKELTEEQKSLLQNKELTNFIKYLDPDVILASFNKSDFRKVFDKAKLVKEYTCKRDSKGDPIQSEYVEMHHGRYYINHYTLNNKTIIHGLYNSGTPFAVFDLETRIKIIKDILKQP